MVSKNIFSSINITVSFIQFQAIVSSFRKLLKTKIFVIRFNQTMQVFITKNQIWYKIVNTIVVDVTVL